MFYCVGFLYPNIGIPVTSTQQNSGKVTGVDRRTLDCFAIILLYYTFLCI